MYLRCFNFAGVTLQIRDQRDQKLSFDEIRDALENFDTIWIELKYEERQFAVLLLVKQIGLHFEKGESLGQMNVEVWGKRPTPLYVELRDFRSRKLHYHDTELPRPTLNATYSLSMKFTLTRLHRGRYRMIGTD